MARAPRQRTGWWRGGAVDSWRPAEDARRGARTGWLSRRNAPRSQNPRDPGPVSPGSRGRRTAGYRTNGQTGRRFSGASSPRAELGTGVLLTVLNAPPPHTLGEVSRRSLGQVRGHLPLSLVPMGAASETRARAATRLPAGRHVWVLGNSFKRWRL